MNNPSSAICVCCMGSKGLKNVDSNLMVSSWMTSLADQGSVPMYCARGSSTIPFSLTCQPKFITSSDATELKDEAAPAVNDLRPPVLYASQEA